MPGFGANILAIPLDAVAKIIQLALTPVFLLTGIATLLNVFSTRLARVAARVEQANTALDIADAEASDALRDRLVKLQRRSLALDIAVILGAVAGAATCMTVLLLFVEGLGSGPVDRALFVVFTMAILCALGAIIAYASEMLMAGTEIRAEVARGHRWHFLRHRDDT